MPWREVTKMEEKRTFVYRALEGVESFTELCREFGISTKTGYKWKARFLEKGLAGLSELSRKPAGNPNSTDEKTICDIIRIKNTRPRWGAKKIYAIFCRLYPGRRDDISVPTIDRILARSGLTKPRGKKRRRTGQRLVLREKAMQPNHIWTVDFKGWWYTAHAEKCEPLTVRDEYSKFILSIQILEKGNISSVKQHFAKLFRRYGLPEIIRSDNGTPFASSWGLLGLTKLSVWWLSLGISLDRIDPGKPAQNGGHERMHRDIRTELQGRIQGDLKLHQISFDQWRQDFNNERPHQALDMKTPSEVYFPSENQYTGDTVPAYPEDCIVRMVNDRGYTNYKQHRIFIGNSFNGYPIALRFITDMQIEVYFGSLLLGYIDRNNYLFTPNQEEATEKSEAELLPMS